MPQAPWGRIEPSACPAGWSAPSCLLERSLMKLREGIAWLAVLIVRGLALWLLIPLAALAWLLLHVWVQKASLRQAVGWYDVNLIATLVSGPFQPLVSSERRPAFMGLSEMRTSTAQRIPWFDLSGTFDLN